MTIEQEFENFFNQSYGSVKGVDAKQKREIKMNFYSGAFRGSSPQILRYKCYKDSQEWIDNYIKERAKEEGIKL